VADDIEQGLRELPDLCRISDALWADSPYNAKELKQLGFEADVVELLVDPARWDAPRNEALYRSVKDSAGIQVLHVGRMAPNKCIEDIIKAFYFTVKYVDPQARLRLVGIDTDTELYSFSLRELANYLGIGYAVEFVGALSDSEVRSMYEGSDVYLCMSEHEGFCLPLIEAMRFELPIIAFAETLGEGGVLVREKRHAEIGALIAEVARPGALRQQLVAAGTRRVADFSYHRFERRVSELITRVEQVAGKAEGAR
jgi:glycosyltransferase involved in cell wall biosynthesis